MADLEYSSELDTSDFVAGLRKMQQENEKTTKKMEDDFSKRLNKASDGFRKNLERTEKEARELQAALDLATKAGVKGIKKLDDETIKLNAALKKLGASGRYEISSVGGESQKLGASLGKLQAAGAALAAVFAGSQVVNFFKSIAAAAISASSDFEVYRTQFETLLGSTGLAQKRLEELARFGVETPFELPEIVEASRTLQVFGGDVLATGDNLRMIGDIAAGVNQPFQDVAFWVGRMFDALQNGQPFGEAAMRLQEMGALSGDTRREMEALQKAGADGNEVFAVFSDQVGGRFAGNMERLSQTLQGITSNLVDFRDNLLRVGGEAYFEQVKEDAGEFLDIISDPEMAMAIESLASALGNAAANAQSLATTPLLESLRDVEPQTVQELADALQDAADALSEFLEQDFDADLNSLIKLLTVLVDTITIVTNAANSFRNVIEPISPILDAFKRVLQSIFAPLSLIIDGFKALNDLVSEFTGKDLAGNTRDAADATKTQAQEQKKLTEAYQEYADARKADTGPSASGGGATQAEEEAKEAKEETTKATEEAVVAEEKLEEATKKTSATRKGASESEGDLTAARKKAAETKDEIAEAEEDLQAKILAAQKKAANELIQAEIDAAQKREDIARKNARRIEDIIRKNRQARLDAATDLSRDEQDIATKAARAIEDFERQQAQKKIDIEVDYRKKLEDIQKDFNRSATQAERNRDAIAFLAALERKDQAIEDAQEQRQTEVDELKVQGEEKRAELERQRQQELEDARVANQRKLQDLQQSLQRELEEQRRANQQELEEARIAEQRKREEIQKSLDAQLEQLRAASQQRIAELKAQLQAELAAIQQAASAARSGGGGGTTRRGGGSSSGAMRGIAGNEAFNAAKKRLREFATASGFFGQRKRFAEGGPVLGLSPIIVGDASEEEKARHQAGVADLYGRDGRGKGVRSPETNPELFVGNSGAVMPVGLGGPELFNPPERGKIIPNSSVGDFFKNYLPPDAMARNPRENSKVLNVNNSRTFNQNVGMLDPQSVSAIAVAAAQRTALEVVKGVV